MRLPIASGVATAAVASTLYPLFQGLTWWWTGLGALLVITLIGVLASRYTVPGWLVPPVQIAGLWIYLTAVFASGEAWAGLFPTRESVLVLATSVADGFADIQRFAAPVPAAPGIMLLTAGGIGLIGVLVDLLAVRTRRAALAGLPLLTLFIVPAEIVTEPIAWPAFILGAAGYSWLLVADGHERIGHWGRAVLVRRRTAAGVPGTTPLRLSGKRVGVTAIALAILLPALVPTLAPNPLFGFGVGGTGIGGGNTISIPNPIVGLQGQLQLPQNATVLTYTSSDNVPRYLRLWSLDLFTGEQWTMTAPTGMAENRVDNGALPAPPGATAPIQTRAADLEISISDSVNNMQFLPLPYPPRNVEAEGDWRADQDSLMVFSTRDQAGGLNYRVRLEEPMPTRSALERAGPPSAEIADRYLRLPRDLPQEIRDLADGVTAGQRTPYDKAVRLQEWFTTDGDFAYSLQTAGNGNSALVDFLIYSKTGYCEQFAASMAVMARILGIPARVAVGYTSGTNTGGNVWQVGTHDMHAWPELYFEGIGWLAFEPTPSGSLGQGTARQPDYTRPAPETSDTGTQDDTPSATSSPEAGGAAGESAAPRNPRQLDREGTLVPSVTAEEEGTSLGVWFAAGLAVLVVLLIPAAARRIMRHRRLQAAGRPAPRAARGTAVAMAGSVADRDGPVTPAGMVSAVVAELDDALYDYGMERQPSETSRALARRLSTQHGFDPEATAAISRLAVVTERVLFARTPGETGPLAQDLRVLRRALAATVSRGRRIRVALMPPSTLRRIRGLGGRILDGFDRLENLRVRRPERRA
ncbi:transglutaminase [Microtetraspora sp. NBRC 13810]|uniref:transglutaminase TgpA family protein n=1 Tax=Microtetraspora sp. NBRC 13810 TaxID=3030990 RepID=UPI0024A24FA2|nr:DUF3488 and transglutaminase-like domain-containing protein [Microtetraspora sp. NBRC 13810]GLW12166.1 transglutaminase [Microtetraspora sp. NBRC 13810]